MKRISVTILAVMLLLMFFGCGSGGIEKPETNLEFWICDNADDIDFSNCKERYGIMGGQEYYGSAYTPAINENGEPIDPEECVIYTVTSYPDYSDKAKHITRITITDPTIIIYGLTFRSSKDEIKTAMTNYGFKLSDENSYGISFEKRKISFYFSDNYIRISADVSNKFGIMF